MATAPVYGNRTACTPCGREGRRVAADGFCVNCDEYYCSPCSSHHGKFTKDHDVQDVSESGRPNEAVYLRDINLDAPSDTTTTSYIPSIMRLSDGRFLVCDWYNKSLKLLDSVDYTVAGDLRLSDHPHTACAVNNDEVAVSLRDKNKVIFVTTSTDRGLCISNRQPVDTKDACAGLLFLNGELYVASGGNKGEENGKVEIYAISGSRVMEKDTQSGQRIFGCPYAFVINSTGSEITVTDAEKGIITINTAGQVLRRCSYPDLVGAVGACTDGAGRVFVVGYHSNNVIMLDHYGTEKVLLSQSDGVAKPVSVCFDPVMKRLLVGLEVERALRVFNLQYTISGVQETTAPTD